MPAPGLGGSHEKQAMPGPGMAPEILVWDENLTRLRGRNKVGLVEPTGEVNMSQEEERRRAEEERRRREEEERRRREEEERRRAEEERRREQYQEEQRRKK